MKTRVLCLILLWCLCSLFPGGQAEGEESATVRILFMPGVADPFYYSLEKGARTKADELGIPFTSAPFPSVWDPDEQILILSDAVSREDYNLVIISPTAKDALIGPLKTLHNRGVSIITVDTAIGDGDYSGSSEWSFPLTHIGTDNYAGGVHLAEYLAEQVHEKGKVYINTTTRETSTTEERRKGFADGIARFPEMELVRTDYNGDRQEVAAEQTLQALLAFPELVGICGTNVFSSQGVADAVSGTGLSGAVKIAAWDATESLIEGLRNGEVDVIMSQKPGDIGALAVEWAYKYLIEGSRIPGRITSGSILFTPSNLNDPAVSQYIYTR